MTQSLTCAKCGTLLPGDAPEEMCPKCLIVAGLMSQVGVEAPLTTDFSPSEVIRAAQAPPTPQPAVIPRLFGGYRIIRPLGKGGMGTVYEAEEDATGRRLALKVLSHSLDSDQARARFFREGRMAASVNHPNSVYVFGTEEIDGMPVITMELAPGGTLQEMVKRKGPLPIGEAVDIILQIIAGLEAAAAGGVLHRDVKPSNCFFDADGTVKVGDFGLSISTLARQESMVTNTGAIMGTPAYASPEQLRGDEIDSRSDIYSVGVTLYYLLTGQMPFTADNMVRLLATVLERPAPSPRKLRKDIPTDLEKVILRCLAKQPASRFRNYEELRRALMPFTIVSAVPAGMGLRFVAAVVDGILTLSIVLAVALLVAPRALQAGGHTRFWSFLFIAIIFLTPLITFVIPEGLWGATIGKAMLGMRVVGKKRRVPGLLRALLRTIIVISAFCLGSFAVQACGYIRVMSRENVHSTLGGAVQSVLLAVGPYLGLLLLFVTARRKNGHAALQDLLSGTRVVVKREWQTRSAASTTPESIAATEGTPRIGPYHVLSEIGQSDSSKLLVGYDTRLFRRVWIRLLPPGVPEVPTPLRVLTRHGRLRWLGGKRSAEESWDAYEALTGRPLMSHLHHPQRWKRVRFWLADLTEELAAGIKDGTLPAALGMDRVWITEDGRAKLLDFPAPDTVASPNGAGHANVAAPSPSRVPDACDAQLFLKQVAVAALEGRETAQSDLAEYTPAIPMPLHARNVVARIGRFADFDELVAELRETREMPAEISKARRMVLLTGCVLPVLMASAFTLMTVWTAMKMTLQPAQSTTRQVLELVMCLDKLDSMKREHDSRGLDEPLEVYIAGTYRNLRKDPKAMENQAYKAMLTPDKWREVEAIAASHPAITNREFNDAAEQLKPLGIVIKTTSASPMPWKSVAMMGFGALTYMIGLPALIAAALFRGGVLVHGLRIAFVTRNGVPARRWRVFCRAMIVWMPILLASVLLPPAPLPTWAFSSIFIAFVAIYLGGAVWSVRSPECGVQDLIARTRMVPR